MALLFEQLNPGPCLTYLIACTTSSEAALVDPVIDLVDHYLATLAKHGLKLRCVIDTHTHADHISGASLLIDKTGCDYIMHENAGPVTVTQRVGDQNSLKMGDIEIKFVHTPGHTEDSLSVIVENRIITGDALFLNEGGAGRADLPGGNPEKLYDTMNRLAKLDENLTVYPGHDYRKSEPSSLKTQKEKNPFLKFNSKEKFVQFLNDLKLGPAEWMKHVLHANTQCTRDPKAVAIPKDMPVCEVMGTLPAGMTCSSQNTQGSECGSSISATELKDRIDHHESMLLLDIREAEELISELGHMTDIKHIPLGQLPTRISELTPYKDETIISICRSGKRAVTAANFLEDNGFNKVVILTGGMIAWNQAGLPIQREPLATV